MPRKRSGAIVAVAAIALSRPHAVRGSSGAIKTATTAKVRAAWRRSSTAAKAEGALNVIALPPEWANYKGVLAASRRSTGSRSTSRAGRQQPAGDRRGQQPEGHGQGARRVRPRAQRRARQHGALRAVPGRGLGGHPGRTSRSPPACGSATTPGSCPSAATRPRCTLPATVADLLKPEYKGKIALNGNPKTAAAGFNGVVMASLANGGSADDIAPGVTFFKQLNDGRQPAAGRPDAGDDRLRPDAVRHRLGVQQRGPDGGLSGAGHRLEGHRSRSTRRRSRRTTSRPSTRTRRIPAAARLWEEFLYTPEAQNEWLKGFARPVLQEKMIADGTIDQAALGKLGEATGTPVVTDARTSRPDGRRLPQRQLEHHHPVASRHHLGSADVTGDRRRRRIRNGAGLASGGAGSRAARGEPAPTCRCCRSSATSALFLLLPTLIVLVGAFQDADGTPDARERRRGPDAASAYVQAFLRVDPAVARRRRSSAPSSAACSRGRSSIGGPGGWLRQVVVAASGVLAQFGGVMLAFAFLATFGFNGLVTMFLKDAVGIDLRDGQHAGSTG